MVKKIVLSVIFVLISLFGLKYCEVYNMPILQSLLLFYNVWIIIILLGHLDETYSSERNKINKIIIVISHVILMILATILTDFSKHTTFNILVTLLYTFIGNILILEYIIKEKTPIIVS